MTETAPKAAIFRSSAVEGETSGDIKVTELLTKNDSPQMSVALVEVNGINNVVINTECDAAYYVLDGEGVFSIDEGENTEAHSVGKGDLIFIPKGTAYQDSGKMTLLVFNSPAFNEEQIEIQKVDEPTDEFPRNDDLVEELLTTNRAEELIRDCRLPSILERNEKERQRWPDFVLVIPPEGVQSGDRYEIGGELASLWRILEVPVSVVVTFKGPNGEERGDADIFEVTEDQAEKLRKVLDAAYAVVYEN